MIKEINGEFVWKDDADVLNMNIEKEDKKRDFNFYENEVKAHLEKPVEEGKIVFYGCSCFARWTKKWGASKPLEEAILSSKGEKVCLNRAFGGSTVHELCYYYDALIKPLKPKAIVLTGILNDWDYYTNEQIINHFAWLINQIKTDFPEIKIFLNDWRPTKKVRTDEEINRFKTMDKWIDAYGRAHSDVTVVKLSTAPMFYLDKESCGSYRNIDESVFVDDKVHFTAYGYDKLAEIYKEVLKDVLG